MREPRPTDLELMREAIEDILGSRPRRPPHVLTDTELMVWQAWYDRQGPGLESPLVTYGELSEAIGMPIGRLELVVGRLVAKGYIVDTELTGDGPSPKAPGPFG